MELNNQNITESKPINAARLLLRLLLSTVVAAVCLGLAYYDMPFIATVFLTAVYLWCGIGFGFYSSALFIVGSALLFHLKLYPTLTMTYDALYFVVLSLIMALMFKNHRSYRAIIAVVAVGVALSIFLKSIMPAILVGDPPFSHLQQALDDATVAVGLTPSTAPSAMLYLPYSIFLGMLSSGIMTVLLYHLTKYAKRLTASDIRLKPMAPVYMWYLSKNFNTGLAVWAIAAILLLGLEIKNANIILISMLVIMGMPLLVQGMCTVWYACRAGCFMTLSAWIVFVLLILFMPSSLYVMVILGLFEQFSRLRSHFFGGAPPTKK